MLTALTAFIPAIAQLVLTEKISCSSRHRFQAGICSWDEPTHSLCVCSVGLSFDSYLAQVLHELLICFSQRNHQGFRGKDSPTNYRNAGFSYNVGVSSL